MQTRVLITIFTVFTFVMLFVLITKYSDAMNVYSIPDVKPYNLVSDDNATKDIVSNDVNWIHKLGLHDDKAYVYPASEMQVKLLSSVNTNSAQINTFRVSVGVIDDYQFFCINQVLTSHKIHYSYYRIGENIWLTVSTDDVKYLKSVLKELNRYDISYTLAES